MRNAERYRETKYVWSAGRLRASRDPRYVSVASRVLVDELAARYEKYLPLHCRGKLVDLGCGSVPLYTAYRSYVTDVTCVDWPSSLHPADFVDQECDLSSVLPFGSSQFDTILLSDVLEHVAAPEHLWGEMARISKPGAMLLWNVPFLYWLHEEPHDYFRYTEFALRSFAERAGFEVLVLEPVGGLVEALADMTSKALLGVPSVGETMASGLQGLAGAWARTAWGRHVAALSGRKFPLAYFGVARRRASPRDVSDARPRTSSPDRQGERT